MVLTNRPEGQKDKTMSKAKMIQNKLDRLNQLTGNPKEPWVRTDEGFKAQVGNFHLDRAYGGVQLVRMVNTSGGDTNMSSRVSESQMLEILSTLLNVRDELKRR